MREPVNSTILPARSTDSSSASAAWAMAWPIGSATRPSPASFSFIRRMMSKFSACTCTRPPYLFVSSRRRIMA